MKFTNLHKIILLALSFTITLVSCQSNDSKKETKTESNLTQFVDPFIGSGGHGHVFVGANVPFGGVQVGPSNFNKGWDWSSSYHYTDSIVKGFTHLNLSGTGMTDLSDFKYIEREMMLIKLEAKQADSMAVIKQISDVFRGKVIDLSNKTFTIELSGNGDKLDAFIEAMSEQTILEVVRSGCIGLARGSVALKV